MCARPGRSRRSFARSFRKSSRCSIGSSELVKAGEKPRNGWALVSVLWTLAMLATMAAALEALTVTSARFEHGALERARLDADIKAGLARAVLGISDPRPDERWRVDGVARRFLFNADTISISVQDERGRIDLNAADAILIEKLLVSHGLSPAQAQTLSGNIVDWRSPAGDADLHRLHGTTDDDYEAAGRAYRPRHGPFQSVGELNLVLGMTPALFSRMKPALTVYSRSGAIDFSVAPREVLEAVHLSDANLSNATARLGPPGGHTIGGTEAMPPVRGAVQDVGGLAGHSFAISLRAEHGRRRISRDIVIEFTGDKKRPVLVEAWQ